MKRVRGAIAAVLAVALAVALGLALRHMGVGVVRVAGSSMQNTLYGGDLVLVTRFDYVSRSPGRGEVVQCAFPGRDGTYIKRVAALPGERVEFFGGALLIDGEAVEEPYANGFTEDYSITLGRGEYLMLGDNRPESYDSRMPDMGPVTRGDILGRARWVLWPLWRFGPVQ